jgi:multidrug efflux pump subunit AcrB
VERFQLGRNDVKVMVRYPREERESLDNLAAMPVQVPDRQQAPLGTVVEVTLTPGLHKLIRQERRRVLKLVFSAQRNTSRLVLRLTNCHSLNRLNI